MATREFNQMLLENTDFLKPFAVTLTKDQEAAKDLLQETMYRALANQEKYSVGTNIKAWLYTIMRNIFINNYRKNVKTRTIEGGEFLMTIHKGPYETISEAWGRLMTYAAANGYEFEGAGREVALRPVADPAVGDQSGEAEEQ